jgi:predicted RNA-binding protein
VAYIVLRQVGVDLSDYQFDYIGQYFSEFKTLEDTDLESSLKRINKTAEYIAGSFREHMEDFEDMLEPESAVPESETTINLMKFKNRKENLHEETPLG